MLLFSWLVYLPTNHAQNNQRLIATRKIFTNEWICFFNISSLNLCREISPDFFFFLHFLYDALFSSFFIILPSWADNLCSRNNFYKIIMVERQWNVMNIYVMIAELEFVWLHSDHSCCSFGIKNYSKWTALDICVCMSVYVYVRKCIWIAHIARMYH